jgi:hypothetical protein
MTTLDTPSATVDLIMSTGQERLGEHTEGPVTSKDEVFCPVLMSKDLEASQQPLAMTISTTSTCHTLKFSILGCA